MTDDKAALCDFCFGTQLVMAYVRKRNGYQDYRTVPCPKCTSGSLSLCRHPHCACVAGKCERLY